MRPDPLILYQATLDILSRAIMTADVATARRMIRLPWRVRTRAALFVIDTDAALVSGFLAYAETLRLQEVTDYVRRASFARYLDADTIEGHHETHTMRGSMLVAPPYDNRMILQRHGSLWRVTEADHQMDNALWPIAWVNNTARSPLHS